MKSSEKVHGNIDDNIVWSNFNTLDTILKESKILNS